MSHQTLIPWRPFAWIFDDGTYRFMRSFPVFEADRKVVCSMATGAILKACER